MTARTFSSLLFMTATTLTLAACQKPVQQPFGDNTANAVNSVETIDEPDTNIAVPANNSSDAIASIPTALLGRWGMVPNDCDVSRSDTKGLMTVSTDSLKFYESMGKLKTIEAFSPTEIRAIFAFSGEGQSWDKMITLRLENGGTTLVRIEAEPTATFKHKKCA